MQGVWRMEANAEILQVGPKEAVSFDVTAISCIESDRGPVSGLDQRFGGGIVSRSAQTIVVRDRTGQPYTLFRVADLPARCQEGGTVGADPILNFETFWRYFAENYAGSQVRGLDWNAIYAEFRPQVSASTTSDELWAIYRRILARFDDVHVFASNGKEGAASRSLSAGRPSGLRKAALAQDPTLDEDAGFKRDSELAPVLNKVVLYEILNGRYSTDLQGKFEWGWTAPGVGYLNIQQMSGLFSKPVSDPREVAPAVRRVMQRVLADLGGADALIIDVRQNRGGADAVGYEVASYFLDRPVAVRSRAKTAAGFTDWSSTTIRPSAAAHFAKPVYLLISDNSVSAAESFAAVIRDAPHVTLVGTPTRGAFSSILIKKLPDGGVVGIANEQFVDARGTDHETKGVAPDVRVESYIPGRLISGYRDAVDVAVKMANDARRARSSVEP